MKKVLLHICCGVCAFYCIESLRRDGFYVEGFFFNPNIHPYFEYLKRKRAAEIAVKSCGVSLQEGNYPVFDWFKRHKAYSQESEGGLRCESCYLMRLEQTKTVCEQRKYDYFTTTLTVSPHKNSQLIFEIGRRLDKKRFLPIDFKKKDGFKKTILAAKKAEVYRQAYCGCSYSKDEREISLIQ